MKKGNPILLLIGLIFFLVSCSDTSNVNTKVQANKTKQEVKTNLPSFKIEDKKFRKPIKATFEIRLDKQISEKEIESIAYHLKNSNPNYERYFITYLLPDMKSGNGAWATSHFNPSLHVQILGLTLEEEKKLNNVEMPKGEIIGKWFDSSPVVESTIIIYRNSGKYLLRQIYKDGSMGDKPLKKKGNIYKYENDFGEYLKIESNGNLGWYSEDGKFLDVKKMK